MFAIEGIYPKDEEGVAVSRFKNFDEALPILSFILSLFSSSFGMAKFYLTGPTSLLTKDSLLNGLGSMPFLLLCLINTMFGVRTICIESAFFSSYRYQFPGTSGNGDEIKTIEPMIPAEYRLLAYFFPCILSFLFNLINLMRTTKGMKRYLMKYPQFLVACCFTPH